ncbi:UDP-N-acetylglucosamine 2-epimerase [Winogradskyella ouciana]|uniref:UDP-N-acetylglucosamine 2-epimerase (Hydrolyzing) n=1 Tax=Winogradskyella ouciana TaxID=2608631 RepID=A0A7K1GEC2_9FLAO|nr:UDP-N-acetylglucosamine 2-epimerase [Winogradskyella ouciana]MTE27395.1 UDP-N-acetylglucosamine 2-epimerase (hydrolyzing) [Winogradskyella ouciana]
MKKIVFLTGTRADFGKLKPLMAILQDSSSFIPHIFVTGMHLQKLYGYTLIEIQKCGFKNIYEFENHGDNLSMDRTLAKTVEGFSKYVNELKPDLIVVHGDRVEALAGSIVGSLNNILVAHIEGGEVSGTIDELLRHATSKMSHIHFVSNDLAKKRLLQMGEIPESVFTIGSPDIDVMFSDKLPTLETAKSYYDVNFEDYAIAMFHPVTTEIDSLEAQITNYVNALKKSNDNYVLIYPNNDLGSNIILIAYESIKTNPKFRIFPSLRFEYFLVLLKNSKYIIGNSSAGIREAPYYGVSTINIGTRQRNRSLNEKIINVKSEESVILDAIDKVQHQTNEAIGKFGEGNSAELFLESLDTDELWNINHQKQFVDKN